MTSMRTRPKGSPIDDRRRHMGGAIWMADTGLFALVTGWHRQLGAERIGERDAAIDKLEKDELLPVRWTRG